MEDALVLGLAPLMRLLAFRAQSPPCPVFEQGACRWD